MGIDIRLPQITEVTEKGQLRQIKSYLFYLVDLLQWALNDENGIVSDFVIEEAQKGIWYYRKWHSGRAECWGTTTITTNFTTAWGSLYVCPFAERQDYPFAFIDRPIELVTMRTGGAACFAYSESGGGGLNTKTQTAKYGAARPTAATEQYTVYIDYHVSGRWK